MATLCNFLGELVKVGKVKELHIEPVRASSCIPAHHFYCYVCGIVTDYLSVSSLLNHISIKKSDNMEKYHLRDYSQPHRHLPQMQGGYRQSA